MIDSNYLLAFICLLSFSVGVNSVTKVGIRPLTAGPFNIVSANDPMRVLDLSFADSSNNNPVIAFTINTFPSVNQLWSFIPAGNPNTFLIQNGVSPPAFLSYPSAPNTGSIEHSEAVAHVAPITFVVSEFSPGPFNISIGGFSLTYWPAPDPSFPSPVTFEGPDAALAPFQKWNLVPVLS